MFFLLCLEKRFFSFYLPFYPPFQSILNFSILFLCFHTDAYSSITKFIVENVILDNE